MKSLTSIIAAVLMLGLLYACSVNGHSNQGIKGRVLWEEGNQMPGPEKKMSEPKGIKREVHIYPLTSLAQAEQSEGYFYSNLQTQLVKKVYTDEKGRFQVYLPAGSYSVFVKEEQGLYANSSDGEGHIQPVTVVKGRLTEIELLVNYKAYY